MGKSKKIKYEEVDASKVTSVGVAESLSDTAQLAALTSSAVARALDLQADLSTLHNEITQHLEESTRHSQSQEKILSAQIKTLDLLFNNLIIRGISSKTLEQATSFISLGFKAQNQLRKTALALHSIQNPQSQTIIKQQNLAYNQQVNNGLIAEKINLQNELLSVGVVNENMVDRREKAPVGPNSSMVTMEKIHRTNND